MTTSARTTSTPSLGPALLWGTLAVGVLDMASAIVFYGLRGATPLQCFQGVASGLLGRASFEGGLASAALGAVLHFAIAFAVTAVYCWLRHELRWLRRFTVLGGMIYGIGVFVVMHYVVVPLSAARSGRDTLAGLLFGFGGHALLVGVPAALIARRARLGSAPA